MNTITADKPFYGSLDPFFIVLWNYLRRRLVARRNDDLIDLRVNLGVTMCSCVLVQSEEHAIDLGEKGPSGRLDPPVP